MQIWKSWLGNQRLCKEEECYATRTRLQPVLSFVQPALERALSWDMIERFQVGEDLIQIKKYGRSDDWYLSRTPQMANACLLRELVRQRYV